MYDVKDEIDFVYADCCGGCRGGVNNTTMNAHNLREQARWWPPPIKYQVGHDVTTASFSSAINPSSNPTYIKILW